jgi:hypothetical protein
MAEFGLIQVNRYPTIVIIAIALTGVFTQFHLRFS